MFQEPFTMLVVVVEAHTLEMSLVLEALVAVEMV
jgi:hypothetical protein